MVRHGSAVKGTHSVTSHHNKVWLRTEYDQAIRRAEQAWDWKQFEAESDVLPNLRWVPSTAAHPNADHMAFWNTVLPINDPFWNRHKPGDRWGCQCSLEATDEPVTGTPGGTPQDDPSPGLQGNPAKTGKLFSEDHPYYPKSCASCPFRTGDIPEVPTNKIRSCYSCEYYNACKNRVTCDEDEIYKDRLLINHIADKSELEDNIRGARSILSSFPDAKIKINGHVIAHGHKNPEYTINGLVADRKGIESPGGISAGFASAIKQGCSAVVIDLDMNLTDMHFRTEDVAKRLYWRFDDFSTGRVRECYVVYHGKAVRITKELDSRERILEELKKIKP